MTLNNSNHLKVYDSPNFIDEKLATILSSQAELDRLPLAKLQFPSFALLEMS